MGVLSKFRDAAVSIRLWNATLLATSRLAAALFGNRVRIVKYYFTVQPIETPDFAMRRRSGMFELGWEDADCPLFARVKRHPAVIANRFAHGARGLLASDKGQLAGFPPASFRR